MITYCVQSMDILKKFVRWLYIGQQHCFYNNHFRGYASNYDKQHEVPAVKVLRHRIAQCTHVCPRKRVHLTHLSHLYTSCACGL